MIQLPLLGETRAEAPAGWTPDALPDLRGVRSLAFDLETTGLRWWAGDRPVGVAVAWREGERHEARYFPFAHVGGGNLPEERVREWCRDNLAGKDLETANGKFDAHMAREWGLDLATMGCQIRDVQHRAALLDDHRREVNLNRLGQDFLGEGKVQGLDPTRGMGVHPAHLVTVYAHQDVRLTARLLGLFDPMIDAEDLRRVCDLEDETNWATIEMERNAFPVDVPKLERWTKEIEREATTLKMRLCQEAGFAVNPRANADMERLFRSRGLLDLAGRTEPTSRFPEGQLSFTSAIVDRAAGKDPVLAIARDLARLESLDSKFISGYRKALSPDSRLRYSLNQLRDDDGGTISGRYSSSKPLRYADEGINIQQVVGWESQVEEFGDRYIVRELFVPQPGALLLAADAKQIQLRQFAHYANNPTMNAAYAADPFGTDYHAVVGAMLDPWLPGFPRKKLKMTNFTRLFGGGRKTISRQTGMSVPEVEEFLGKYDLAFPDVKRLGALASKTARERGYVRTLLGRRTRFQHCPRHGWEGSAKPCDTCPRLHKALNGVIQGDEGDVVKAKLCVLYRERKALGITMRAMVHDETLMDVPDAEAARRVGELLDRQDSGFRIPILWSTGVGRNWREAK